MTSTEAGVEFVKGPMRSNHQFEWTFIFGLLLIHIAFGVSEIENQMSHTDRKEKPVVEITDDHRLAARQLAKYQKIGVYSESLTHEKQKAYYTIQYSVLPTTVVPLGKKAKPSRFKALLLGGAPIVIDNKTSKSHPRMQERIREAGGKFKAKACGQSLTILWPGT